MIDERTRSVLKTIDFHAMPPVSHRTYRYAVFSIGSPRFLTLVPVVASILGLLNLRT